jgi:signal transduction histidine kinase/ligand-binding sensor domain-containing protein/CheY-like chemotaxis protein
MMKKSRSDKDVKQIFKAGQRIGCVFLFLLFVNPLLGQQGYRFEHYTTFDGLPQNSIFDLAEDDKGFLWIATYDGIACFDGSDFLVHKPDFNVEGNLQTNIINVVAPGDSGVVWVGTRQGGLSFFDQRFQSFKGTESVHAGFNILNNLSIHAVQASVGQLWIGTNQGLHVFQSDKYQFLSFGMKDGLNGNQVSTIVEERDGWHWVGTNNGLQLMHLRDSLQFFRFENYGIDEAIRSIHRDKNNRLWIVTPSSIVSFTFSFQQGITHLQEIDTRQVSAKYNKDFEFQDVVLDNAGNAWIATQFGLLRTKATQLEESMPLLFTHESFNEESLSGNNVEALYVDAEGLLWIGTRFNGLNKYDPYVQPFVRFKRNPNVSNSMWSNDVRALCEDRQGHVWIGYRNQGIDSYSFQTGQFKHLGASNSLVSVLSPKIIRALYESHTGELLVGAQGGIFTIKKELESNAYRFHLPEMLQDTESLEAGVYCFYEDSSGNLWIGTTRGLFIRQKGSARIQASFVNPFLREKLRSQFIRSITEDHENNIWVGTDGGGVVKFSATDSEKVTCFTAGTSSSSLSHSKVYAVCVDYSGRVWIGTHNGLNQYQAKTNNFKRYTENHGLSNNLVYSIIEDDNRHLWLSTANGLSRFNPETGEFKNYLSGFEFSDDAFFKSESGRIYMGGINGFYVFHPDSINHSASPPPVSYTNLRLFGEAVDVRKKYKDRIILQQALKYTSSICLNHDQNFFSVDFIAPSKTRSDQVKYKYQLEGLHKGWIHTENPSAYFTNLSPGSYELKVQAANADGEWNSQAAVLRIEIRPAFYQRKVFQVFFAIFMLVGLLFLYWLRINRLSRQKRILESKVASKTRELLARNKSIEEQNVLLEKQNLEIEEQRNKVLKMTHEIQASSQKQLRFFTSISHEIRTPLTLIVGPLADLLEQYSTADKHHAYLSMVNRNAKKLLKLVNQLLDFRKMDVGHMPLQLMKGDLSGVVRDVYETFVPQARDKGVKLEWEVIKTDDQVLFDPDIVEKVLGNLLSNAIKYTNERGHVLVQLDKYSQPDRYVITVDDSGIGIPMDERGQVFQRFFRASSVGPNSGGSGIGLALAKELAQLHKGDLKLLEKSAPGCRFVFVLPVLEDVSPEAEPDHTYVAAEIPVDVADFKESKVLVVEDDADLRQFIVGSFKELDVIQATNGEEGIHLAKTAQPDIVISDILMPVKSGLELCQVLKNDEQTNHIPIILLTALGSEEQQLAGIQSGADDYMVKPFHSKILRGKVLNILAARERFRTNLVKHYSQPKISDPVAETNPFLDKVQACIVENMSDSTFGVEALAQLVGLSRSAFYRKMKALTGESAVEFIRMVRLKQAYEYLLKDPQCQVSEVAYLVGFEDVDYFGKCFKKQFRRTPGSLSKTG